MLLTSLIWLIFFFRFLLYYEVHKFCSNRTYSWESTCHTSLNELLFINKSLIYKFYFNQFVIGALVFGGISKSTDGIGILPSNG